MLFLAVSAAERSIGQLAGVGQTLPNPHLLIGPFVRREAVLSSRIEGTHATLTDLVLFEQSELVEQDVPDVREVSNYVRAMKYGLKRQGTTGVGLTLIREMHQLFDAGCPWRRQDAGKLQNNPELHRPHQPT